MSTEDEGLRPHKRLRTSGDSPSQPESSTIDTAAVPVTSGNLDGLKRHEEFWLDDGSIVLVAGNTVFRVYRALLSAQSTVFEDTFSSSSPNTDEMFEGCPVVHLSDSPEDLAHFLRVLLPKSRRTLFKRQFDFSFHQISAVARLAHKYHVQDVLEQALSCIEEYFTSSFETWEADSGQDTFRFRSAEPIGIISLARLVDRASLLPIAFYECALLDATVLKGYEREDKSIEFLDQSDLIRCIAGRNRLASEAVAIVSQVFVTHPCLNCESPVHCAIALKRMLVEAIGSGKASDPNVLEGWTRTIRPWAIHFRLCDPCKQAAIDRDAAACRRVWAALPHIFDIQVEGWNGTGGDGGDFAEAAAVI